MAQHHALAVAELRVHCGDSSVLDTLLLHRLHTAVELTYRHVPQRDVLVHEVLVGVALRPPVLQLRPADAAPAVRGAQPVAVCSTIHSLDLRIIFLPDCWAGPIQIANCSGASM